MLLTSRSPNLIVTCRLHVSRRRKRSAVSVRHLQGSGQATTGGQRGCGGVQAHGQTAPSRASLSPRVLGPLLTHSAVQLPHSQTALLRPAAQAQAQAQGVRPHYRLPAVPREQQSLIAASPIVSLLPGERNQDQPLRSIRAPPATYKTPRRRQKKCPDRIRTSRRVTGRL